MKLRAPVWAWRALMACLSVGSVRRFGRNPIPGVEHRLDIDYVGDGIPAHRLDVIKPRADASGNAESLPVYIYFHGGGWTSGDKAPLTKYCASQAVNGMVVVNVNYRKATRFQMRHILQDAAAALAWVANEIASFGGDPDRIVLGGDSAGGQIAALLASATRDEELAEHYGIRPMADIRGVVQHCSAVDFSVILERGFIMSLNFIRMLLPGRGRGLVLSEAIRFLSPIEWIGSSFPPVFVTTSERDLFYGANVNFLARLRSKGVNVESLIYGAAASNTRHTWQQDARFEESQEVYRRLQAFVREVAMPRSVASIAR
jgi:acetyl esterase